MSENLTAFVEAVQCREPVSGLTHNFYRYPARFSPVFARAAIEAFSKLGDIILDPFMGGGTTLVEARALGRMAIGADINALAVFISKAKTTLYTNTEIANVSDWTREVVYNVNLHSSIQTTDVWAEQGYLRHLNDCSTWPIRKLIKLIMESASQLPRKQQLLARCIILKTAQWALDCRTEVPNAKMFREKLLFHSTEIIAGAKDYARTVKRADTNHKLAGRKLLCLQRSVVGLENDARISNWSSPKLILTSPPYPGVHVLYHRWQIQGRRETAAPFWITNTPDGSGASFYTFGDRKQKGLSNYYKQILTAFTSLAQIVNKQTLVVQMIAFSEPSWQLARYLMAMEEAGFQEIKQPSLANAKDDRLWRAVPNRKWYANQERACSTSQEVVLFHRLAR